MPTYYFHAINEGRFFDPHGLELPDEQSALRHGEELATFLAAVVEVTDTRGKVLARYSPKKIERPDHNGRS
jgi:hypothetical protein